MGNCGSYCRGWLRRKAAGHYNSEQYGDTNNLVYERFKIEEGYDPRDFITSRMSALDVVQVNGHIPQLFEIVRRLCPLHGDPATVGGSQ